VRTSLHPVGYLKMIITTTTPSASAMQACAGTLSADQIRGHTAHAHRENFHRGYDRNEPVNLGTNQFDLKPSLFLHKTLDTFSIDLAVKVLLQAGKSRHAHGASKRAVSGGLLGCEFFGFIKLGPSLIWMKGDKRKYSRGNGLILTGEAVLFGGREVYFRLSR
jgi:hypothetical protein